jgi:hypothetical protein
MLTNIRYSAKFITINNVFIELTDLETLKSLEFYYITKKT